jgi:KDO2-lipid IV(A) lauroyltransferase
MSTSIFVYLSTELVGLHHVDKSRLELKALRLGAPVFSCIARRLPGNEVRYEVRGRRVNFEPTGNVDDDVLALTTELSHRLEEEVRAAPEQYFWFHKRWKTRPPEERYQHG